MGLLGCSGNFPLQAAWPWPGPAEVLSHPNILGACSAFLETRLPAGSRLGSAGRVDGGLELVSWRSGKLPGCVFFGKGRNMKKLRKLSKNLNRF